MLAAPTVSDHFAAGTGSQSCLPPPPPPSVLHCVNSLINAASSRYRACGEVYNPSFPFAKTPDRSHQRVTLMSGV